MVNRWSSRMRAPHNWTPPASWLIRGVMKTSIFLKKPDQKGGLYEALLPQDCELKYGKEYEFRVRLADLTGGGPVLSDEEKNDAPATSASIIFRRYVAPKQLTLTPMDPQPAGASGLPSSMTVILLKSRVRGSVIQHYSSPRWIRRGVSKVNR